MPAVKMREAKTGFKFGVVSRLVTIYTPSGKRIRNPRFGQPEAWNVSADLSENVRAAILTAIKRLKEKHLGIKKDYHLMKHMYLNLAIT